MPSLFRRGPKPQWHMEMCVSEKQDLIERDFDTVEDWEAWLKENHPKLLKSWHGDKPDWKQYGTGYYWSSLEKIHG